MTMKTTEISRRRLLGLGVAAAGAGLALATSARAADACFDPDTLPASQKSMRRTLGYQLHSSDPKKRCGLCAFFTAAAGDCGKCALLNGGPVVTGSVCNSWAPKG